MNAVRESMRPGDWLAVAVWLLCFLAALWLGHFIEALLWLVVSVQFVIIRVNATLVEKLLEDFR